MKIFAFILALMVFSLSASTYTLDEHRCAVHHQTNESIPDAHHNNHGHHDCPVGCIPFHQCCSCTGFTLPAVVHQETSFISKDNSQNGFPTVQTHISSYIGDIWQPPKKS